MAGGAREDPRDTRPAATEIAVEPAPPFLIRRNAGPVMAGTRNRRIPTNATPTYPSQGGWTQAYF